MKKISMAGLLICLVLTFISCGGNGSGGQYPRFSSSDNEIVKFTFPAEKNKNLTRDVTGVIADSVITLDVPHSTDTTSLVAEYTTNSTHVEVNGNEQSSGMTSNNYSDPVEFTVVADNGEKQVYKIVVNVALSSEKNLTAFSINGIEGVINDSAGTVSIDLPARTALGSLAAVFETAGKSVTAGAVTQKSGVTLNDFSAPLKYSVTAEDGTVKDYTVTVSLLKDTAKEFLSFVFTKSDNPSLTSDVSGIISGDGVKIELPYGSGTGGLKAYFETFGKTVTVNDVPQESGVTVNDFTTPAEYVVTAENGDVNRYTVTVTVAKSDARSLTEYVLDGETGIIDEAAKTVTVTFPSDRDLTGLIASFVSTGVSVSVNKTGQVSKITKNDFSSAVSYTVTADNGAENVYTVNAVKTAAIAGLWNFEYGPDGSYTVNGATVTDGALGSALHFNKGNYVLVPDSDLLTLASEGTIEAVIKADSHQPFAGVVHKGVKKDFSDESYSLQFWGKNGTDGTLRFSIFNSTGGYAYVDSSKKLETGTWYHVAASWNADEIKLFVNGNLEDSIPNTVGKVRDSAGALVIGAQLPVTFIDAWSNLVFNGTIDSVRIYSTALADGEIINHYKAMPFSASSALTAYILAVAVKNYTVLGGVFGFLILVLAAISLYNRKSAKHEY